MDTKKIRKTLKDIKTNFKNKQQELIEINSLISSWKNIMAESGVKNNSYNTLTLSDIVKKNYGFDAVIYAPYGLSFNKLEDLKPFIEHSIGCTFTYKYKRQAKYATCQFITKPIDEIKFKPVDTNPYELYLATGIDGDPVIVSMLKFPHLIDTGATNMGKTKLIDCITTNLICNNNPDTLKLFFIQVDKCDQAVYKRCKHTVAYGNTLEKALAITSYLLKMVEHRNNLLEPLIDDGIGNNIYDYNKFNPKNPWSYCYLIIDEYASLMPDEAVDNETNKLIKKTIQGNMEKISQISRSVGLYIILGLQRSTANKLPSFVKANMNTNVTFKQNNTRSSQVAIDSDEAVFLDVREAILKLNDIQYIKTATLTNEMIVKYIDKYRIPKNEYKDKFDYKGNLKRFCPKVYHAIYENEPKETNKKIKKKDKKIEATNTLKSFIENESINNMNSFMPDNSKTKVKPLIDNKDKNTFIQNNFNKVDPNIIMAREEQLRANISKIKNFVPYNPTPENKVIDKTIIPANAPLYSEVKKGMIENDRNEGNNPKR